MTLLFLLLSIFSFHLSYGYPFKCKTYGFNACFFMCRRKEEQWMHLRNHISLLVLGQRVPKECIYQKDGTRMDYLQDNHLFSVLLLFLLMLTKRSSPMVMKRGGVLLAVLLAFLMKIYPTLSQSMYTLSCILSIVNPNYSYL